VNAKHTLLVLGLMAALQAVAADQTTNTVASATVVKSQVAPANPILEYKLEPKKKPVADRSTIDRYDGMSSQAWTTIATRRTDNSAFHDCMNLEPNFDLLSLKW
jgi:hypothetical protein